MTTDVATSWTPYMALCRTLPLPGGRRLQVFEKGSGEPLLYLHGAGLQRGWNDTLARLAESRRVIAPLFAGFGESTGVEDVNDVLDAVMYINDALDALGLDRVDVAGFDLGGMFAAELAAVTPARVKRLVLVAPFGLWIDGEETADFFAMQPPRLRPVLFAEPDGAAAETYFAIPENPPEVLELTVQRTRALSASSRFLWPIPERGLVRRLHRIKAHTRIVWGERDRLISTRYAEAFRSRIGGSTVTLLDGGHMLPLERPEQLASTVQAFFG